MTRKRALGIYKGVLARPIVLAPAPTFWGAVVPKRLTAFQEQQLRHERANRAKLKQQFSKKLNLLFDHFGIEDKGDTRSLALALAREHVPGFTIQTNEPKPKRGRKLKWDLDRLEKLLETVESLKQQHNYTDRQALIFIVSSPQYSEIWGRSLNDRESKRKLVETLESQLQNAKRFRKVHKERLALAQRDLQELVAKSTKFRK